VYKCVTVRYGHHLKLNSSVEAFEVLRHNVGGSKKWVKFFTAAFVIYHM